MLSPVSVLKAISALNHVYQEDVEFYYVEKQPCPDCTFDPIRKESTNINCPTCGGDGYIETTTVVTIPCSVETDLDPSEVMLLKGGEFWAGSILVTIDKKEMDMYGLNINNIGQVDHYVYMGQEYELDGKAQGTLAGNIYELALLLRKRQ